MLTENFNLFFITNEELMWADVWSLKEESCLTEENPMRVQRVFSFIDLEIIYLRSFKTKLRF